MHRALLAVGHSTLLQVGSSCSGLPYGPSIDIAAKEIVPIVVTAALWGRVAISAFTQTTWQWLQSSTSTLPRNPCCSIFSDVCIFMRPFIVFITLQLTSLVSSTLLLMPSLGILFMIFLLLVHRFLLLQYHW